MKTKIRNYVFAFFVIVLSLFLWSRPASAVVRPTDVTTPSAGNTLVYVDGTFVFAGKETVLNRLNEIRLEAYKEGYATSYVPLKWSRELETIAQTRAAEASIYHSHVRPNGLNPFSLTANGHQSYGENLAWNWDRTSQAMMNAIEQFYKEKTDYVTYIKTGQLNGEIGHYQSMIDPSFNYVGMGTFFTNGDFYTTTSQQFSFEPTGSEAPTGMYGNYIQLMEVKGSTVVETSLAMPTVNLIVGQTSQAKISAKLQIIGHQTGTIPVQLAGVKWSTGNGSIAGVDNNGLVRGQGAGTTTITASAGATIVSKSVTVKAITALEAIQVSTKSGRAPNLPATVLASWSDGSKTQEKVTWSTASYSNLTATAKTVTLTGTVANTGIKATAKVTIHGIRQLQAVAVTTKTGVAPILPSTVTANWTDGTSSQESVTWPAISSTLYSRSTPGQFTVSGQVQASSLAVKATVHVITIKSAIPLSLATKSGQLPSLPATVSVTWSNGSRSQEPVTWPALKLSDFTSLKQTRKQIKGQLANSSVVSIATVTIHSISKLDPVTITTLNNTAPVMPQTVTATWTDGSKTQEKVTWNGISASLYSNKFVDSTFVVAGKVQKTNIQATATVKVIVDVPKSVYRLYHGGLQVHLYTTDDHERSVLTGRGWNYEGVSWKTATKTGDPVYRLYHPSLKVHLYTKDQNEYKVLAGRGWLQEGVAYRSFGTQPIYRLYHAGLKKHLYTRDTNEYAVLATRGWKQEGIAWYSLP